VAMHKVLSTKKIEPSLLVKAKEQGIEIIEQEAIRVTHTLSIEKWHEIFQLVQSNKQVVAFTSSNAVLSIKKYIHEYINPFDVSWKIFALSGKTREVLEQDIQTFGTIVDVADDSKALAQKIVESGSKEVIFFCGNKRRDELPVILRKASIKVHEVVVYETVETPTVAGKEYDAVLFFSPSAVQSFFSVNQLNNHTVCFAIGQTTANSISAACTNKIIVARSPGQEILLQDLINYFKRMVSQD
jgi:uroporphyrinogen-III synthase